MTTKICLDEIDIQEILALFFNVPKEKVELVWRQDYQEMTFHAEVEASWPQLVQLQGLNKDED